MGKNSETASLGYVRGNLFIISGIKLSHTVNNREV